MDIIQSEAGQPLREELARSPNKIIQSAFPPADETTAGAADSGTPGAGAAQTTADAQFLGVALVSALVKLSPDWLTNNRLVFDALVRLWQSPARQARLINEQGLSLNQASILFSC
jgi:transformation/transcription domain-associated protein